MLNKKVLWSILVLELPFLKYGPTFLRVTNFFLRKAVFIIIKCFQNIFSAHARDRIILFIKFADRIPPPPQKKNPSMNGPLATLAITDGDHLDPQTPRYRVWRYGKLQTRFLLFIWFLFYFWCYMIATCKSLCSLGIVLKVLTEQFIFLDWYRQLLDWHR